MDVGAEIDRVLGLGASSRERRGGDGEGGEAASTGGGLRPAGLPSAAAILDAARVIEGALGRESADLSASAEVSSGFVGLADSSEVEAVTEAVVRLDRAVAEAADGDTALAVGVTGCSRLLVEMGGGCTAGPADSKADTRRRRNGADVSRSEGGHGGSAAGELACGGVGVRTQAVFQESYSRTLETLREEMHDLSPVAAEPVVSSGRVRVLSAAAAFATPEDIWEMYSQRRKADLAPLLPWVSLRVGVDPYSVLHKVDKVPGHASHRLVQHIGQTIVSLVEFDVAVVQLATGRRIGTLVPPRFASWQAAVADLYSMLYSKVLCASASGSMQSGSPNIGVPGLVGQLDSSLEDSLDVTSLNLSSAAALHRVNQSFLAAFTEALQLDLTESVPDWLGPFLFVQYTHIAAQSVVADAITSAERFLGAERRLLEADAGSGAGAQPPAGGRHRKGSISDKCVTPCVRMLKQSLQRIGCASLLGCNAGSDGSASEREDIEVPLFSQHADHTEGLLVLESAVHLCQLVTRFALLCHCDVTSSSSSRAFGWLGVGFAPLLGGWLERLLGSTLPGQASSQRRRRSSASRKRAHAWASRREWSSLDHIALLQGLVLLSTSWTQASTRSGLATEDVRLTAESRRGARQCRYVSRLLAAALQEQVRTTQWVLVGQTMHAFVLPSLAGQRWLHHKPFAKGLQPSPALRFWLSSLRGAFGIASLASGADGMGHADIPPPDWGAFDSLRSGLLASALLNSVEQLVAVYLGTVPSRARMPNYKVDVYCIICAVLHFVGSCVRDSAVVARVLKQCDSLLVVVALVCGPWEPVAECLRRLVRHGEGGGSNVLDSTGGVVFAHGQMAKLSPGLLSLCRGCGMSKAGEADALLDWQFPTAANDVAATSQDWGVSLDDIVALDRAIEWNLVLADAGMSVSQISSEQVVELVRRRHELGEWDYPKLAEWEVNAAGILRPLVDALDKLQQS